MLGVSKALTMDFWYYSCYKSEVQNRLKKRRVRETQKRKGKRLQLPPVVPLVLCLYTHIHIYSRQEQFMFMQVIFEVAGKDC